MNDLIPVFRDTLFESGFVEIAKEVAEKGIDSVLVDGVLKEIPIVNTVFGVGKAAYLIRNQVFLEQTCRFFAHLHDGSITTSQFQRYKEELENDQTRAKKELSRVIILLDRFIDTQKTRILACFYRAYIINLISWERFHELSEALDRLFITDIQMLYRIRELDKHMLYEDGGYVADRLVSVGLVRNPTSNIQIGFGSFPPFGKIPLQLTEFGIQFIELNDKQPVLE